MPKTAFVLLVCLLAASLSVAGHWELEQVDQVKRVQRVQVQKDSLGRLYVCYDSAGTANYAGVVRVASRDGTGWRRQDIFHGVLGWGQPCFCLGPHGEMCVACFDTTRRYWLVERSDTCWTEALFPVVDAGNVSVAYDTAGRLHCGYLHVSKADYWIAERTDTGWSSKQIFHANGSGFYVFSNLCLAFSSDNRAWYLTAYYWERSQHQWGCTMALLRGSGTVWDTIWLENRGGCHAVALAVNGDTTGFCRYPGPAGLYLHYFDELVDSVWYWQNAGMTYDSNGVPHIAYLAGSPPASVKYAFRTNRWHIDTVPGSGKAAYTDIVLDSVGQPLIVFGTPDSGVWLARGVDIVGVEETPNAKVQTPNVGPSIVRGSLWLADGPSASPSWLFDASGRPVASLRPGPNDVSGLAPGVYFVREQGSGVGGQGGANTRRLSAVKKVIVTR